MSPAQPSTGIPAASALLSVWGTLAQDLPLDTQANDSLDVLSSDRRKPEPFGGDQVGRCVCGKGCGHKMVEGGVRFHSFKIDVPTH